MEKPKWSFWPIPPPHMHACMHAHICPALLPPQKSLPVRARKGDQPFSTSSDSLHGLIWQLFFRVEKEIKESNPQAFLYCHLLSLQLSLWRHYLLPNLITSSLWRAPRLAFSPQSLLQALHLLLPALTVRLSSLNEWTALLGRQPEGPKPSCSFLPRWPFSLLLVLSGPWAAHPALLSWLFILDSVCCQTQSTLLLLFPWFFPLLSMASVSLLDRGYISDLHYSKINSSPQFYFLHDINHSSSHLTGLSS